MKKKTADGREWYLDACLYLGAAASAAVLVWFLALKPYPAPRTDAAFWAEAKSGRDIAVGIDEKGVVAAFWSPFEPEELRSMLLDVEGYPTLFPTVPKMKKLSGTKDSASASGSMRVIGPLTVSFAFGLKAEDRKDGAKVLLWDGTATGLRSNGGSWTIRPESGGSAVETRLELVPAGRIIPQRVWNRILVPFTRHALSFLGVHP